MSRGQHCTVHSGRHLPMRLLLAALLGVATLTVPADAGRIVFLDIAPGGRVLSASTDGGEVTVVSPSRATGPDGIVIDPNTRRMFWTTMGAVSANDGTIEQADLNGGHATTIVSAGGTFTPKQIKLDGVHGKLYWAD